MSRLKDLTEAENTVIGCSAATVIAFGLQPLVYAKNARQQKLPLSLDPRMWFRGVGVAYVNELVQLGLQFPATGAMARRIPNDLAAAASAGAVVAVLASPLELIMIQQQRFGGSLLGTARNIALSHGVGPRGLFHGVGMCMSRDAIYVGGMLGATPLIQRQLSGSCDGGDSQSSEAVLASLAASMMGGAIAGLLSAPFDLIKTCQQGDLDRKRYGGVLETARALHRESGGNIARLFDGAGWRVANIALTAWFANECSIRLPKYILAITRGRTGDRGNG